MARRLSIDCLFPERHGIAGLSNAAFRLHVETLCYARLYDISTIPIHVVKWMCKRTKARAKHIDELILAGVWFEEPGGFMLGNHHRPRGDSRPAIPLHVRFCVYERDGGACLVCGTTERLTLDHIIPFSKGGSDTLDNLRTLCMSCNGRRGAGRYSDDELRERGA